MSDKPAAPGNSIRLIPSAIRKRVICLPVIVSMLPCNPKVPGFLPVTDSIVPFLTEIMIGPDDAVIIRSPVHFVTGSSRERLNGRPLNDCREQRSVSTPPELLLSHW